MRATVELKRRSGKSITPNTFNESVDPEGAYGLMWAICSIQDIVSASKIVHSNYGELINKTPF